MCFPYIFIFTFDQFESIFSMTMSNKRFFLTFLRYLYRLMDIFTCEDEKNHEDNMSERLFIHSARKNKTFIKMNEVT